MGFKNTKSNVGKMCSEFIHLYDVRWILIVIYTTIGLSEFTLKINYGTKT